MQFKDNGGGDFEQPPVGTHVARCVKLIDLGTQKGEWQGKATFKRQVVIGWELPNALLTEGDSAGKPFVVSKFYTQSLSEKSNLRADLKNWRGRDFTQEELAGFDAKNILGKPCMLSLTENDKGKVRVTGVMALPNGMDVSPQINDSIFFSLSEFDQAVFDSLSNGFKAMIEVSPEYQAINNPDKVAAKGGFDDFDDDIPF